MEMMLKFIEELLHFGTCDFLFFAKSPSLKLYFHKISGATNSQKATKIHSKIRLEKKMQKSLKKYEQITQNGAKIHQKSIKNRS